MDWPMDILDLSVLQYIETDAIKEIFTINLLDFLSSHRSEDEDGGAVKEVEDLSKLAKFYCSGKFSEPVLEAMVKAVVFLIVDPDKEGVTH